MSSMHPSNLRRRCVARGRCGGDAEPGLLVAERRHRIVELLREHGKVTVEALAARFATSAVTIRTDLAALEAGGALERTHGGALLRRDDDDQPLNVKRTLHHAEKVRIAKAAVALIKDGETMILDSGTTTAEIAKQIRKLEVHSINVITNALNIAVLLADVPVGAADHARRHPAPRIELPVGPHGRSGARRSPGRSPVSRRRRPRSRDAA